MYFKKAGPWLGLWVWCVLVGHAAGFQAFFHLPQNGQDSVPNTGPISVEFNTPSPLNPATVHATNVTVRGSRSGNLPGTFFVFNISFNFVPDEPFLPGEHIQVTLTTNIMNMLAQRLDPPETFDFVARADGCTVFRMEPGRQDIGFADSQSAALGDLDDDGDLDVVIGSSNVANEVWFNNGDGIYSNSGQSLGFSLTQGLALGDLDGDRDVDIFMANDANFGVASEVWLNDGNGVFTNTMQSLGTNNSYDVDLGDLDGDGDLDAVVANSLSPNRIYINDGTGLFTDSGQLLAGDNTHAIGLGDFDDDGDLDAYIGNFLQADLILTNQNGVFYDSGQFLLLLGGESAADVQVADLDGDNDLDAFVAHGDGSAAGNYAWLNDGAGVFNFAGQVLGFADSRGVALADFDGDMDLDAFVVNHAASNSVWINDGSAQFSFTNMPSGTFGSWACDAGDLDLDGDVDVYVGNSPQPDKVWFNRQFARLGISKSVFPGDVQEDQFTSFSLSMRNAFGPCGVLGLVVTDSLPAGISFQSADTNAYDPVSGEWDIGRLPLGGSASLRIGVSADFLTSDSTITNTAGFKNVGPIILPSSFGSPAATVHVDLIPPCPPFWFVDSMQNVGVDRTFAVALEDIDRDGDFDAVIGPYGQPNLVFRNNGSGVFTDTGQALGNAQTRDLCLADLDGNGSLDLVEANEGQPNLVYLNTFGVYNPTLQTLGASDSFGLACGDLDGDNDVDLFVANTKNQPNQVWLNDGTGNFSSSLQNLGTNSSQDVVLGDLDGDGDLDAFVANLGSPDRVWVNQGDGTFLDSGQLIGGNDNSESLALGDFDGDGDLDVFVGTDFSAPDKVWINDGAGAFASNGQVLSPGNTQAADLADMDGDGDLDIVAGLRGDPNAVYINDGAGQFTFTFFPMFDSFFEGDVALGDLDGDGDVDVLTGVAAPGPGFQNHVLFNELAVDVSINVSASATSVAENDPVTLTLVVSNECPCVVTGLNANDLIPTGLTFVASSTPDYNPGSGAWTIGDLPVGVATTLLVDVTVDPGTTGNSITNVADVTPTGQVDTNMVDNMDQVVLVVGTPADLGVTKSADPLLVAATNRIMYTILVTNLGPTIALNVTLGDAPASGTQFDPAGSDPAWAAGPTNVMASLGDLPSGASTSLLLWVIVDTTTVGVVTNAVLAITLSPDPDPTNNLAFAVSTVTDNESDGIPDFHDPDDDNDCMPDIWEILHAGAGLNPTVSNSPTADFDGDGMPDLGEYSSDTIPTDSNSVLKMQRIDENGPGYDVQWKGGVLATQYLERTFSLLPPLDIWAVIHTNPPPTAINNLFPDASVPTNRRAYYRVRGNR